MRDCRQRYTDTCQFQISECLIGPIANATSNRLIFIIILSNAKLIQSLFQIQIQFQM